MPSPEQIREQVSKLEPHCWAIGLMDHYDLIINPDQRWVGRQYGASFELTRPGGMALLPDTEWDYFELILKGKVNGKERLLEEFKAVLGKPKFEITAVRFVCSTAANWDAHEVLDKLTSEQASA